MTDTTAATVADPYSDAEKAEFYEQLQAFAGQEMGIDQHGSDPVNVPMIRQWVEAMGDKNPIYLDETAAKASVHGGLVAPPSMLPAWVMRAYGVDRNALGPNPYADLTALVESHGFTSVVASNSEHTYDRYLRPGDEITLRTVIDSVSPEKQTALGAGHFISTRQDYFDQTGERVGSMLFRILKFRPKPQAVTAAQPQAPTARPLRPRPATTHDIAFFFDGLNEGKLLIQKCSDCATLRHPPGPMCRNCHSLRWTTLESTGNGTIHSFVVVHYPQVPSFDYPNQVVLVELDEGVRIVANTLDISREQLRIGARVHLVIQRCDDDLSLPFFALATGQDA
ncbi:MAG: hypothetical protein JWL72_3614 [Ilumatobacteraceae bacterium]|nr:hypothetical protein [Ilumatobacteraceae bacterium]